MHARDDPPGVLRTVAGSVPCACAGHTCSQAFNLNRTISGWGDCLPIAEGGTVPAPPWYNFSAARSVVYMVAKRVSLGRFCLFVPRAASVRQPCAGALRSDRERITMIGGYAHRAAVVGREHVR